MVLSCDLLPSSALPCMCLTVQQISSATTMTYTSAAPTITNIRVSEMGAELRIASRPVVPVAVSGVWATDCDLSTLQTAMRAIVGVSFRVKYLGVFGGIVFFSHGTALHALLSVTQRSPHQVQLLASQLSHDVCSGQASLQPLKSHTQTLQLTPHTLLRECHFAQNMTRSPCTSFCRSCCTTYIVRSGIDRMTQTPDTMASAWGATEWLLWMVWALA